MNLGGGLRPPSDTFPQEGLRGQRPRSNCAARYPQANPLTLRETGRAGASASPVPTAYTGTFAVSPFGPLADVIPTGRSVGVYVHVPFCVKRCDYCSFNTAPLQDGGMPRYLGALQREIALLKQLPWADQLTVPTIFFGGGTPSLLEPAALAGILDALRTALAVDSDAEITVEANPESVTSTKLAAYRAAGVNRLSLGVQSLDDDLLPRLGRLHTARQAHQAFEAVRQAGFTNVSVDLMYGLPDLDVATWTRTVTAVLDWQPEHLSAYGLTLDAQSRWGATGVEGLPAEGTVVEQYWALVRAAAAHDFEHYEISNYARPGRRSRHNQIYWHAEEYLACGPGGCGFIGDVRYAAVKPVARYADLLEAGRLPLDSWEQLTLRQRLAERLILGLRTADGVPAAWLAERSADDRRLGRLLADWREQDLLREAGHRVTLSESGFLLSDALFVELL